MRYTINAVKRTALAKKDGSGTWNKVEVKLKETGDTVYELGRGISKYQMDKMGAGFVLNGYITDRTWGNGNVQKVLNGITSDYLYDLIKIIDPDIETKLVAMTQVAPVVAPAAHEGSWSDTSGGESQAPAEEINPNDIGW